MPLPWMVTWTYPDTVCSFISRKTKPMKQTQDEQEAENDADRRHPFLKVRHVHDRPGRAAIWELAGWCVDPMRRDRDVADRRQIDLWLTAGEWNRLPLEAD